MTEQGLHALHVFPCGDRDWQPERLLLRSIRVYAYWYSSPAVCNSRVLICLDRRGISLLLLSQLLRHLLSSYIFPS